MDKKQFAANSTSWNPVSHWYARLVGQNGHYFHQNVIIPKSLALLKLSSNSKILDIGCGSGVLTRYLPKSVSYVGIDASTALISQAKKTDNNPRHKYLVADVAKSLPITEQDFTHAAIILALQNIREPGETIANVFKHLLPGSRLLLVLNHLCFRIPRQSAWGIDEKNKMQYRRLNCYLSPQEIPITIHPGRRHSPIAWTFHHSLSDYSNYLYQNNFLIEKIEEWTSTKVSAGKAAKMENRARSEFPLFLAILAVKKP